MSEPAVYVRIAEGEPLPDISVYAPFRAVVVLDGPYSPDWQTEVSDWLVASGCHYMMAWGEGCSSWDDSVDYALLAVFDYGEIPDESMVWTTWHEREPLIDVFDFAQFGAMTDLPASAALILHIGITDRRDEFLRLWADAPTLIAQRDRLN